MRICLGGGVSVRGIRKIEYRARMVIRRLKNDDDDKFIDSLSEIDREKMLKEISQIPRMSYDGIAASLLSVASHSEKVEQIFKKYRKA